MNLAETMQSLYAQFGELDGITIECQNELLAIGIENQAAKAEVFLQGAQISHYQRHHEKPILWLSDACTHQQGKPLRGGIPICWPWFGDINKNPQAIQSQFTSEQLQSLPAHGFVRERDWQITLIETPQDDLTIIELSYTVFAEQERLWPFASTLRYRIEIGQQLKATLTIENQDSMPFTFSAALHTYFSVTQIDQIKISGLDNSQYIDALDNWSNNIQKGDVLIDEEVDRIYQSAPDIHLNDGTRDILIKNENSNSTVVWNPWVEKSKTLSQFNDDDYQQMLCIETGKISDDAVYLDPTESYSLSVLLA